MIWLYYKRATLIQSCRGKATIHLYRVSHLSSLFLIPCLLVQGKLNTFKSWEHTATHVLIGIRTVDINLDILNFIDYDNFLTYNKALALHALCQSFKLRSSLRVIIFISVKPCKILHDLLALGMCVKDIC